MPVHVQVHVSGLPTDSPPCCYRCWFCYAQEVQSAAGEYFKKAQADNTKEDDIRTAITQVHTAKTAIQDQIQNVITPGIVEAQSEISRLDSQREVARIAIVTLDVVFQQAIQRERQASLEASKRFPLAGIEQVTGIGTDPSHRHQWSRLHNT